MKMLLNGNMVFINRCYSDRNEALREVCRAAEKEGFTDTAFEKALLSREEEYPTGLRTGVPLAIPHAASGCSRSFMSVSTFREPVAFRNMDGTEEELPAEMMFVFGVSDPSEENEVFIKLAQVLRNAEALADIKAAKDEAGCCEVIMQLLGDELDINTDNNRKGDDR